MEHVETVVIGAGQAGLAVSYHLSRLRREHIVFERARVAERWRTQRWDSLMFQFPNWSIELPGQRYEGNDPDGFSPRDAIVRFLEDYRTRIAAPVRSRVDVTMLRPAARPGRYVLATDHGEIEACNVVIATGPYQRPKLPALASRVPPGIVQVHAGEYRNPGALPAGAVLVVGSGASGCQIAEELLEAGRGVFLAVGRHCRIPRRYRGRDVFWWRRELGHLDMRAEDTPVERRMPAPLVTGARGGHDVDLRAYAANGMTLLGHVRDWNDHRIALAPDLDDTLRKGDDALVAFTVAVDALVARTGMDAPRDSTRARPGAGAVAESPTALDLRAASIRSVVWATGYELDFGWIALPIFDSRGQPVHSRGVTAAPGVYLLGLRWLCKAKSSFLCGVGEDAEFIAERIAATHRRSA
jgi:putative flavoprotein involved in K+ transport